jgi:hypothetical protein
MGEPRRPDPRTARAKSPRDKHDRSAGVCGQRRLPSLKKDISGWDIGHDRQVHEIAKQALPPVAKFGRSHGRDPVKVRNQLIKAHI